MNRPTTSCATCYNPALGWSDGLPTAKGVKSAVLGRASPTVFNTGYNTIQMWDGRQKSLEDQAMFAKAYPGKAIDADTVPKAIASFERTALSNNSRFDRWVRGEAKAMSAEQVEGFKLFAGKANCVVCHAGPNFTDNGFHNLGLASWGAAEMQALVAFMEALSSPYKPVSLPELPQH